MKLKTLKVDATHPCKWYSFVLVTGKIVKLKIFEKAEVYKSPFNLVR
jgi:hypothetical protein